MEFEIIVAVDCNYGIGSSIPINGRTIQWNIPEELEHFKEITTTCPNSSRNCIIMGRKTADTLKKPLSNRLNIVITTNPSYRLDEGFVVHSSLDQALLALKGKVHKAFVIGGAQLYEEAILSRYCTKLHLTTINQNYSHDIILNSLRDAGALMDEITPNQILEFYRVQQRVYNMYCKTTLTIVPVIYDLYVYKSNQEQQYLNVLHNLLHYGHQRQTRNAVTYSMFSKTIEFDLQKGFPLLTCKKMFTRGIIEELLFFLRGETDTKILEDKKVMIWKGNTNKAFIESMNLPYEEYDMGPMYGFQWRYFNAPYKGSHQSYEGQGVDQFKLVVDLLIKDPYSRRIVMTTFNPEQADEGVLYPCHGLTIQFYTETKGSDNFISLQMYQRSADWFLGVPFNIASYAFLLHIIVNLVNNMGNKTYQPGRVIMVFGDVHFYSSHLDQVQQILSRTNSLHRFPNFHLDRKLANYNDINQLTINDFIITDYFSEEAIKADMIA